jgi:hypothetical protein
MGSTLNGTWDNFFGVLTILESLLGLKAVCQVWCKLVYPFSSYKRTPTISILKKEDDYEKPGE